ncbi:hypothetical protein RYX36_007107 [Vicia faba]
MNCHEFSMLCVFHFRKENILKHIATKCSFVVFNCLTNSYKSDLCFSVGFSDCGRFLFGSEASGVLVCGSAISPFLMAIFKYVEVFCFVFSSSSAVLFLQLRRGNIFG